jgi:hypothetical protein
MWLSVTGTSSWRVQFLPLHRGAGRGMRGT